MAEVLSSGGEHDSGDLIIRPARREDAGAIADLERVCFSSPWSKDSILSILEYDASIFFVAEKSAEVIGYASMMCVGGAGQINNVAVDPRHRRAGVGRRLMEALIASGRGGALAVLELEVRAGNAAAIRLYESLGFAAVGRRPRYYRNPPDDALLMDMNLL